MSTKGDEQGKKKNTAVTVALKIRAPGGYTRI